MIHVLFNVLLLEQNESFSFIFYFLLFILKLGARNYILCFRKLSTTNMNSIMDMIERIINSTIIKTISKYKPNPLRHNVIMTRITN